MENDDSIIYGIHPVAELLATKLRQIDHLYFDKERQSSPLFDLIKLARKERLRYQLVPTQKLDYLCGSERHQGVVAVCSAKEFTGPEALLEMLSLKTTAPLLLVPASVEDPRNLGAIIRSAVAFGVDAVLLERKNTAPIGSTVAKASAGLLERMPLVKPKNLEGLIATLVLKGFLVVGAQTGGPEKPQEVDCTGPTVIVIGGEDRGIPPYLMKQCARLVGIPIAPDANSLNVSAAASVLLYECARQRNFSFIQK